MTAYKKKIEDLYPFHQKPISAEYWGSKIERKIVPSSYTEKTKLWNAQDKTQKLNAQVHKMYTNKNFRSMYR